MHENDIPERYTWRHIDLNSDTLKVVTNIIQYSLNKCSCRFELKATKNVTNILVFVCHS